MSANYNELIWGLEELASEEEQIRLWCGVGNESNEVSSLSEAGCSVFNFDVERILDDEQASFSLSVDVVLLLKELRKNLNLVPNGTCPKDQIEHPKMEVVRCIAHQILVKLNRE